MHGLESNYRQTRIGPLSGRHPRGAFILASLDDVRWENHGQVTLRRPVLYTLFSQIYDGSVGNTRYEEVVSQSFARRPRIGERR